MVGDIQSLVKVVQALYTKAITVFTGRIKLEAGREGCDP